VYLPCVKRSLILVLLLLLRPPVPPLLLPVLLLLPPLRPLLSQTEDGSLNRFVQSDLGCLSDIFMLSGSAQTSAFDDAYSSWAESKMNSPEFASYLVDIVHFEATVPYKSFEEITGSIQQTRTDPAALAQWSSGVAKFPPADRSYIMRLQSDEIAFADSLSKSVEAMATSATATIIGGLLTGSISIKGREAKKVKYVPLYHARYNC
jgi:hypothetical protein